MNFYYIISYLAQLEVNYDPCWLCLNRFKDWLVDQLRHYQRIYSQNEVSSDSGVVNGQSISDKSVPSEISSNMSWYHGSKFLMILIDEYMS